MENYVTMATMNDKTISNTRNQMKLTPEQNETGHLRHKRAAGAFLAGFLVVMTLLFGVSTIASADVVTIRPDAVVVANGWSGVTAANLNDQSDASFTSITNALDTFTVGMANDALYGSGATINSVTAWVRANVTGGGGAAERVTFGSSQPSALISGTNTLPDDPIINDFSFVLTNITTAAEIDALEIDVNTTTLGAGETAQVFEVWVVVDYTPSAGNSQINSCNGCHAEPPNEAATRNATGSGEVVGSHAAHSVYACTQCHPNNVIFDHRASVANPAGEINTLANIQGGFYDQNGDTVNNDSTGFAQDNDVNGVGLGSCRDVACHGGASSVTPQWGDAAGLNCDGCHGAPPATNAHATHYTAKGWANPDVSGATCDNCHPDNTVSHSDVTDSTILLDAGLTATGTSPTISCGTAPALGCHNGSATPNWDTGAAITCTDCHSVGGSNAGQANPVSGLHNMTAAGVQKHDSSIAGGCEACHTKASIGGHWDGSNGGDPPNYTDVQVGVSPGVTGGSYTDAGGTGTVRGTCATTCHSDSGNWSRQWSTAADSTSTTTGDPRCDVCHGQFGDWRTGTSHEGTFGGSASTRGSGHNSLGGAANACEDCHLIVTDGFVGNLYHENNFITVNNAGGLDDTTAPPRVWCSSCHSNDGAPTASGTHTFQISDFPLEEQSGPNDPSGSCFGCHGGGTAGVSQSNYWPDDSNLNAMNTSGTHVTHIARIASRLYGETITGAVDNDILMDSTTANPGVTSDTKQKNICEYCHAATANDSDHGVEANLPADVFVDADTVRHAKTLWGANDTTAAYNNVNDTCSTHACHNGQTTLDNVYGWYDLNASSCVMCHTPGGTTNIPSGIIHPNSGLHNITPTVSGTTHDDSLDAAGCNKCHTMPVIDDTGASTHINGTAVADGTANTDRGLFVDYSDAATGSCSGGSVGAAGCHDGAGDAGTWARRWSLTADDGGDAVCANCHGGLGANDWTFGGDNVVGDGSVSHGRNWDQAYSGDGTAEVIGNHSGNTDSSDKCNVCHVNPDAPYNSTWGTGNHGNDQIEMNSTFGYAQASWNCSSACHTGAANTDHTLEDSGWTVGTLAGPGLNCTSCHGGGSPAAGVSSASPHVITTRGGVFNACEDCHPGNTRGAQHAKSGDVNVIAIPNNTDVGINYSHTVDGGTQGFVLGGDATIGTTEAEICWNCHDDEATDISEWGTNTGGTYDYGSVTNNDLNWTTTTWSSANFAYKNGPLNTRPTDGDNAEPKGPGQAGMTRDDNASMHNTKADWKSSAQDVYSEALADIGCSYCHDVHDTGGGVNGQPFLRGSWTPSDYLEDGAPLAGTTYATSAYANTTSGPPRTQVSENTLGGYQIDQNNGTNHSGYVYATDDGLCANCHDQATLQTRAPLHKNSVQGFSNDTGGARNIFTNADRSTAVNRQDPGMAYQGVTDYADAKGWMGGFRNELAPGGAAAGVAPVVNNQSYGYQASTYEWGVSVTNTATVDADFHSFTCSKCHNPHASRLPRLMITNCLDVQRNTWDDGFTGGNHGNWPNVTPNSGEGNDQIAYANTAQNCHRYFPALTGSGSGIYEGKGWNQVTPW